MEATKADLESNLARQRILQAETETHLTNSREDVILWLDQVVRACVREKHMVKEKNDIAYGEIQVPWDLLQASIQRLRTCQSNMKAIQNTMTDLIADLAEVNA